MAGGSQTIATGVAAVVGTVVAVAAAGYFIWNATAQQRTHYLAQIDALNAKIDKTDSAIAALQTAILAQKPPSFDGITASLADLNGKIEKTGAALTDLKAMAPAGKADADKSMAALAAKFEATDKALADIKSATSSIAEFKTALAGQQQALQKLAASLDGLKTGATPAVLTSAAPASAVAKDDAKMPSERELVVVYMPRRGGTAEASASVGATAPLSVRFDKIGSTNAGSQTQALAGDIKKIVAGRKGCVVAVSGFADTLGGDKINLAVSRERAGAVASGLHTALGQDIEVKEVAWGERHLAVWTPDNKSEKANRRVDISVDCKS
ncbi:MAG: hypothetical protein KIT48_18410 [Pseudolabrys sp.]|nr:hypothetical protein [Pseudolabrys sp.]